MRSLLLLSQISVSGEHSCATSAIGCDNHRPDVKVPNSTQKEKGGCQEHQRYTHDITEGVLESQVRAADTTTICLHRPTNTLTKVTQSMINHSINQSPNQSINILHSPHPQYHQRRPIEVRLTLPPCQDLSSGS